MSGFAERLEGISAFKAMKVLSRANELEQQGREIIHLEVGEPDFATPRPIIDAAMAALEEGETKYTAAQGIVELRRAISDHYRKCYGLDINPDRIFVTSGGSGALLLTMALLINSGDGMLMTDPGYPCNRHFIRSFGGEAQLVPVSADDNFQLNADLVKSSWQSNTKAVLLASPSNPTGSLINAADLEDIALMTKELGGKLVVDEIYHGLHYGSEAITTGLSYDSIVINSFSKYFGMTGWRLGWMVVPDDAIASVEKLAQNLFICPSTIAQHAALAAFTPEALEIMEGHRMAFEQRRNLLVSGLRALGFGIPLVPDGAFYVYAQLPASIELDSEAFCEELLETFGVAATPGTDFGSYLADRHVRFSYANDEVALNKALVAIAAAVQ